MSSYVPYIYYLLVFPSVDFKLTQQWSLKCRKKHAPPSEQTCREKTNNLAYRKSLSCWILILQLIARNAVIYTEYWEQWDWSVLERSVIPLWWILVSLFGVCCPPLRIFVLIWRWRAAKFDICSALMAIEQWGFFSVQLWQGTSVNNVHLRGPMALKPVAERLVVWLSLPVLTT